MKVTTRAFGVPRGISVLIALSRLTELNTKCWPKRTRVTTTIPVTINIQRSQFFIANVLRYTVSQFSLNDQPRAEGAKPRCNPAQCLINAALTGQSSGL